MIKKTKPLYIILPLIYSLQAIAQEEGTILYEETVRLHLVTEDHAEMPPLPQADKTRKIMHFNSQASLYETLKAAENPESESEDGRIRVRIERPEERYYYDVAEKKFTAQREFLTRTFLVESSLPPSFWKLTGNQKKIGNYACMEATATDNERKITAWFTPEIPVSSGPLYFAGLPGMILHLDINNGEITVEAKEINTGKADASLIKKPTEGKKMNRAEFEAMRKEKMKEMEEVNGGNNVIIQIRER